MIKIEITQPMLLSDCELTRLIAFLESFKGVEVAAANVVDVDVDVTDEPTVAENFNESELAPVQRTAADIFGTPPVTTAPPAAPVTTAPPAAPVTTAPPAAPVTTAPPVTPSVELDSDGYPWDRRIHSGAKTKVKDGTWKKLRNLDPGLIEDVQAELEQSRAAPALLSSADAKPMTFPEIMTVLSDAIAKGLIVRDQVNEIIVPFGLPSFAMLSTRPDLIPSVYGRLKRAIDAAR